MKFAWFWKLFRRKNHHVKLEPQRYCMILHSRWFWSSLRKLQEIQSPISGNKWNIIWQMCPSWHLAGFWSIFRRKSIGPYPNFGVWYGTVCLLVKSVKKSDFWSPACGNKRLIIWDCLLISPTLARFSIFYRNENSKNWQTAPKKQDFERNVFGRVVKTAL